jgi:hypothetical protein
LEVLESAHNRQAELHYPCPERKLIRTSDQARCRARRRFRAAVRLWRSRPVAASSSAQVAMRPPFRASRTFLDQVLR